MVFELLWFLSCSMSLMTYIFMSNAMGWRSLSCVVRCPSSVVHRASSVNIFSKPSGQILTKCAMQHLPRKETRNCKFHSSLRQGKEMLGFHRVYNDKLQYSRNSYWHLSSVNFFSCKSNSRLFDFFLNTLRGQ